MSGRLIYGDQSRLEACREQRDSRGLVRLLRSGDPAISESARDALAGMGEDALDLLLVSLRSQDTPLRLGIIGVLARVRSPRAVDPLLGLLTDPVSEIRWQTAIALGEIGDSRAVLPLCHSLQDPDKYVRYGAAVALTKIGWSPSNGAEKARYFSAVQEWTAVRNLKETAVPELEVIFADRDPLIRQKILRVLGEIGSGDAGPLIVRAMSDTDREVRWQAVLASRKCGVPLLQLPQALARRPRTRKNPVIAGFLNFMLPGLGYGYLGKWWGIMIFQIDITATVWLFKAEGQENTFLILLPLYLILAVHAWYLADRMPDDPP